MKEKFKKEIYYEKVDGKGFLESLTFIHGFLLAVVIVAFAIFTEEGKFTAFAFLFGYLIIVFGIKLLQFEIETNGILKRIKIFKKVK